MESRVELSEQAEVDIAGAFDYIRRLAPEAADLL